MSRIFEKLLGPNWRTSTNGMMGTLFMLYSAWNVMPEEIRHDWSKVWPVLVAAIFKTWQDFTMKDRAISGNAAKGWVVAPTANQPARMIAPKKDGE